MAASILSTRPKAGSSLMASRYAASYLQAPVITHSTWEVHLAANTGCTLLAFACLLPGSAVACITMEIHSVKSYQECMGEVGWLCCTTLTAAGMVVLPGTDTEGL